LEAHREAVLSMAAAVAGFTIYSPDERARQILRDETVREIEYLVDSGHLARARVKLAYAVRMAEARNPLDLSRDEIHWLRRTASEVEAALVGQQKP
jgi:hypothetical protein